MTEPNGNNGPTVGYVFYIIIAILVCLIAAVIIHDASGFIGTFGKHLMRLFENAGLNPNNPRKFGNFVELILIAGFFGWALSRFRKK